MSLEYWDPVRNRWILYRNQEEHGWDCKRYPFDAMPRRIFLDTNIINLMIKQRASVFEQEPIPSDLEQEAALDTEALKHLCSFGVRAPWTMIVCGKSIEEISYTSDPRVRRELFDYALEMVTVCREQANYAADLGRRVADSQLLAVLTDRNDQELLSNAIGLQCDVFCTRDIRTIVRKRETLPSLPIRILTPREWWSYVKPWGGLFT